MKKTILRVENLYKTFRSGRSEERPLQDISFCLSEGEILGIVGESGCGKSTLLRVISGLVRPDSGHIYAGETEITKAGPGTAGKYMQMVFQDAYGSFDPRMTMRASLLECASPENHTQEALLKISGQTGLAEELLERHPAALSGGQCQRFSIARAILTGAHILLCDEITSALDVTTQAQVVRLLQKLVAERSLSLLFVSHDLALVSMICDRVMVMQQGRVVEEGETQAVIRSPQHACTKELLRSAAELNTV